MKEFFGNLALVTLPIILVTFLVLELFFRFIIPASEPPYYRFEEKYSMLLFDKKLAREGINTIGRLADQQGYWHINNFGWNSPIDYNQKKHFPRVVVIGDSYVEALQVDTTKNFASILREKLKKRYEVYSFGMSGSPLSQYLHIYRYSTQLFDPDIIIVNVVHNDFSESITKRPNHFLTLDVEQNKVTERNPIPYVPSKFRRIIRKSAFFRYLYINLHLISAIKHLGQAKKGESHNANIDVVETKGQIRDIQRVTSYLLERFQAESKGRRIIFIMDAPRRDIYAKSTTKSSVRFLNTMFAMLCKKYGFEYLDLTESMVRDYDVNQIKFNSEIDAHWNDYGHQFVAEKIATTFFSETPRPKGGAS